jgi:hypothetical protein
MDEELCERCGWLKNPLQLATLEYHGVTIQVCFPCLGRVAGVIRRTPLVGRIGELVRRKEIWRMGREKRERRAS